MSGAEIDEFAPKVGVKVPLQTRDDAEALRAYRDAFVQGIREHNARGETARSWALQFLIRRCAWHMLDHAWEMEDRDRRSEPEVADSDDGDDHQRHDDERCTR